jgi:hypothetical protein
MEAENKELASDYQSIGDDLAEARKQIAKLKAENEKNKAAAITYMTLCYEKSKELAALEPDEEITGFEEDVEADNG